MVKHLLFLLSLCYFFRAVVALPQLDNVKTESLFIRSSSFWIGNIARNGQVAYGNNSNYQIFRNVMDFGATGDGSTDDTAAINSAVSSGNRCDLGCQSSTTTPAIVYFPPGTYIVSQPIIQYYYTQFIGDATDLPVLKASSAFTGIAVIDSDPYDEGVNWYINTDNFYRQVRNFVIDITDMPSSAGACIHWQVAQATSLQNIRFEMVQGGGDANKQQGIFMDNGSGGFMSDLTFNGGNYGMFLGNQQFTSRALTFNGCNTAIFMNWNWLWAFKSLTITNCGIGIDIANAPSNQTVGSITLQDSQISNTPVGVRTAFTSSSIPTTGGTMIIDNVDFTSCPTAIESASNSSILTGGSVVSYWAQGRRYTGSTGTRIQQSLPGPSKPSVLLDSSGAFFERSKPQYENVPASNFVSIKSKGAVGDGVTDDTAAIQSAMSSISSDQILYFDHGAYVVSDTIAVPSNIKITGEIWPLIMAKGNAFQDQKNPKPVFQIGQTGDVGNVELSDLVFETIGPQPGAIMMEWNVAGSTQGAAGMWDVHFRIGGSAGTNLEGNTCPKQASTQHGADPSCIGAFLLFHATPSSSAYVENSWLWTADHDLDLPNYAQITIYNGRGVLIESQKATWMYGTSAEHSVLYNYALGGAQNVFMSAIQTETPYFQGDPVATTPFRSQHKYWDPNFNICKSSSNSESCEKAWGLQIKKSQDILIYSAGLYSFYDNFSEQCLNTESCQTNMVHIIHSKRVSLFNLNTKAAVNMLTHDKASQALDADNRNNFCATIAMWTG